MNSTMDEIRGDEVRLDASYHSLSMFGLSTQPINLVEAPANFKDLKRVWTLTLAFIYNNNARVSVQLTVCHVSLSILVRWGR